MKSLLTPFTIIVALLAGGIPTAHAELVPGDQAAVTREFMDRVHELSVLNQDTSGLAPFRILLVPGLLTDVTAAFGQLRVLTHPNDGEGFLASFYQQSKWMRSQGIEHEFVPINRSGSCDENGETIAQAILRSPKPVIIVTQSKGGVDTLQGLIRHPEVRRQVAAWVAYQPPHDGSVLADIIQENGSLRRPTDLLLKLFHGTALAIGDMTTPFRLEYNFAHQFDILGITLDVPIVTLVTTEQGASLSQYVLDPSGAAFLGPFVPRIAERDQGPNDGIASVHGTCLTDTACVRLQGIDHFASVMDTAPYKTISETDRVSLFRALLKMAVKRSAL